MKFQLICDADSSADLYLTQTNQIVCDGQLSILPYSPTLGDLTLAEAGELFAATVILFSVAFVFRLVADFLLKR